MKLYHGTSQKALDTILRRGIEPRRRRVGNFAHTVSSCPAAVYLTDAYPVYFAAVAAERTGLGAVLEIDTDLLDTSFLNADEDVLEQVGRRKDNLPADWDMKRRVKHYRDLLPKRWWSWQDSLKAMGTCSYIGTIPVRAITKIARIDFTKQKYLRHAALDASITCMNYRFCAHEYKEMTKWVLEGVFSEPVTPDDSDNVVVEDVSVWLAQTRLQEKGEPFYSRQGRDGIEVTEYATHDAVHIG